MQAVESETLILYHTDLHGEWPEAPAGRLRARLRYGKRLAVAASGADAHATLAGIALALRALAHLRGGPVSAGELVFPRGAKPHLAAADDAPARSVAEADFSIAHSGAWVGCAAVRHGRVGFDVEVGNSARIGSWVAREAVVKACGAGLRALDEVRLDTAEAHCRGELWHAHTAELFPGARACVMTSLPGHTLTARAVPLAELFDP